ncbi:MAG: preprotein translocase subunit YajC [Oscillospiraceae bacterium]|nr:preprotein translocase subunit YajC [Oscillospiraceae bacterium]
MNTALLNVMLAASAGTGEAMPPEAAAPSLLFSLIITIVPFVLIFYFMILRPQKKKEKEAKQLRDNLQIGDEVTTIGGITGIVVRKTEDTVVIETGGDRSKIRVKLWAISENATIHDAPEEEISKK